MESDKFKEISDEMIGNADKACNCSSRVVEMMSASTEGSRTKGFFKKMKDLFKRATRMKRYKRV